MVLKVKKNIIGPYFHVFVWWTFRRYPFRRYLQHTFRRISVSSNNNVKIVFFQLEWLRKFWEKKESSMPSIGLNRRLVVMENLSFPVKGGVCKRNIIKKIDQNIYISVRNSVIQIIQLLLLSCKLLYYICIFQLLFLVAISPPPPPRRRGKGLQIIVSTHFVVQTWN